MTAFLNTIILMGGIQGLVISFLLFTRKAHRQSDRLLAVLIFLMSLASFNLYFLNTKIFEATQLLRIISYVVPFVIVMPVGPLIYFYIRSRIEPSFRLKRAHKLQFFSGFIDIVPELVAVVFIIGVYTGMLQPNPGPWGLFIDRYNMYADIPRWLSLTIYIGLSYGYLKKATGTVREGASNPNIKWLRQFITIFLVFQAIWLVYLIPYVLPAYSDALLNAVDWYPIYIPLSIMIYWLGIKGYLVGHSFSGAEKKKRSTSSELTGHVVEQTTFLLNKAMKEDKIYLNPALNLELVTNHTGLPAKTVSTVLNQHYQKNFNEWLNGYRIEAFKEKISQGQLRQMTIWAVALECGFNSQASFQRIFKQSLGMTPSEYVKASGIAK